MKKLFLIGTRGIVSLLAAMVLALYCNTAMAVVDYMEILTIGTSTTSTTGSSTVLADTTRNYSEYPYFEAQIYYSNPSNTGVPMKYYITTGTPTATSGAELYHGDMLLMRNLEDMKNFKACAGTTTAASYGTAAVFYCPAQKPDKSPVYVNP